MNYPASIQSSCTLADGNKIPWLGLGTYQLIYNSSCEEIVTLALNNGYRHIDTATLYGNEIDIGKAIKKSGIPRNDIFITTKLWNDDHGKNKVVKALKDSLYKLQLDYVDLYLIHWPVPRKRMETWEQFITLKKQGLIKSIGVSNYTEKHLHEIFDANLEKPVINQVEWSPYLYQKELLKFCTTHNISLQAYSPLTKGRKLEHPKIKKIALKYNKTNAQIILRWILELGVIVLPKTQSKSRIIENASLFDFKLDEDDHKKMASLHANYRTTWDPTKEF